MSDSDFIFCFTLLICTFVVHPIAALLICKYAPRRKILNICKLALVVFLPIDLTLFCGYSIKGDYVDYIINSLQVLWVFLLLFSIQPGSGLLRKILWTGGMITMIMYTILMAIGGWFIIALFTSDLVCAEKYHLPGKDKTYEIREYINGTDATVTFEFVAYQEFKWLPIEKRIDKTEFITHIGAATQANDTTTNLNPLSKLHFNIVDSQKHRYLIITDDSDHKFIRKTD